MSTDVVRAAVSALELDVAAMSDVDLFSADVDFIVDRIWEERESRLRRFRDEEDLSQAEIADRVGRSQQTVSRWLDRFGIPTKQRQVKVRAARTFGNGDGDVVDAEIVEPSPSEAAEQLRQIGGGQRSPEVERRLAEARGRQSAWSDVDRKRHGRITDRLDAVLDALVALPSETGLSRPAVGEALGRQATELAHVLAALRDLAFGFER